MKEAQFCADNTQITEKKYIFIENGPEKTFPAQARFFLDFAFCWEKNKKICQRVNISLINSVIQSLFQSYNQSVIIIVSQPASKSTSQSVFQPISQSFRLSVSRSVLDPLKQSISMSALDQHFLRTDKNCS